MKCQVWISTVNPLPTSSLLYLTTVILCLLGAEAPSFSYGFPRVNLFSTTFSKLYFRHGSLVTGKFCKRAYESSSAKMKESKPQVLLNQI